MLNNMNTQVINDLCLYIRRKKRGHTKHNIHNHNGSIIPMSHMQANLNFEIAKAKTGHLTENTYRSSRKNLKN